MTTRAGLNFIGEIFMIVDVLPINPWKSLCCVLKVKSFYSGGHKIVKLLGFGKKNLFSFETHTSRVGRLFDVSFYRVVLTSSTTQITTFYFIIFHFNDFIYLFSLIRSLKIPCVHQILKRNFFSQNSHGFDAGTK